MPTPNLVDPIEITIEASFRKETTFDDDTREPVHSVKRRTIKLPAQREPLHRRMYVVTGAGPDEQVRGHFTIRRIDLEDASLEAGFAETYFPQRGDKIVQTGSDDGALKTELYITQFEPRAHWGRTEGASLFRLYYADRRPAAAQPAM